MIRRMRTSSGAFFCAALCISILLCSCGNSSSSHTAVNQWHGSGDDPGPYIDPNTIGDPAFTLVWSHDQPNEGPDIDLWVLDPKIQLLSSSRDGYSLGPTPETGQIDQDDQGETGPGDGGGPERAFWPQGSAPAGVYIYGIRYYTGVGTANYTLRVYEEGNLTKSTQGVITGTGTRVVVGTACNVSALQPLCNLYIANPSKFGYCQDLAWAQITGAAPAAPQTSKTTVCQALAAGYIKTDEGTLLSGLYDPVHETNLREGDIVVFFNDNPPNDLCAAPHYAVVHAGVIWSIWHWDEGGQLDGPRTLAYFGNERQLYNPWKGEFKTLTNVFVYFYTFHRN